MDHTKPECALMVFTSFSYRRLRSFSSAFITIQSKSPRIRRPKRRGSDCRNWETRDAVSPKVLMRLLGLGGSSSRMIRRSFLLGRFFQTALSKRRRSRQEFIKQYSQRENVATRIHVGGAQAGLFRAHIQWSADQGSNARMDGTIREAPVQGFGHSEVDDLGHRFSVEFQVEQPVWSVGRGQWNVREPQSISVAAAFLRELRARSFDQNPPHGLGRSCKKMSPTIPSTALLHVHQSQIGPSSARWGRRVRGSLVWRVLLSSGKPAFPSPVRRPAPAPCPKPTGWRGIAVT